MRNSTGLLLMVAGLVAAVTAARAEPPATPLVYPDKAHPAPLRSDRLFEIHAALRLPLTPPPGVQQPAAVRGWQVVLSAKAWTPSRRLAPVRYALKVVRIRPLRENIYRILAEIPPWLPEGVYDIEVSGPGYEGTAPAAAVRRSADAPAAEIVDLAGSDAGKGKDELVVPPAADTGARRQLRFRLPSAYPGISVTADGKPLSPSAAAFGALPYTGERLLIYDLPAASAEGVETTVTWQQIDSAACEGTVSVRSPESGRAMDYRELSFHGKAPPASVIWDFGDGRYGNGASVRHRWLLSDEARVTAWRFDGHGRVCKVAASLNLSLRHPESGCAFTYTASERTPYRRIVAATLFFLFSGAFGE